MVFSSLVVECRRHTCGFGYPFATLSGTARSSEARRNRKRLSRVEGTSPQLVGAVSTWCKARTKPVLLHAAPRRRQLGVIDWKTVVLLGHAR